MTVSSERSVGHGSATAPDVTLVTLAAGMDAFVQRKGWYAASSRRPQTPRNLAVSIAIEAAELVECFQWSDRAEPGALADEMADVLLYLLQLANVTGVDLGEAAARKLVSNDSRTWDLPIGPHA